MKTAEVRSRIEPMLKQRSSEVLTSIGLDMSDAIRLFLRQVVEVGGLPFAVRKPTPETIAAMTEAREIARERKARFEDPQELFDALDHPQGRD
jgi:DNA-damage-inducible protein J